MLRAEVFTDSFGEALLPLLKLRFECVAPIPLADLLRSDVPATNLVLDVIVERKIARDAPTLPARAQQDLLRVEPARRFRAAHPRLVLEGAALSRVVVRPTAGATLDPRGLELPTERHEAYLSLPVDALGVTRGWARLELEVSGSVRLEAVYGEGVREVVFAPGLHALTVPTQPGEAVEVRLVALGDAPLAVHLRRVELHAE